ncbi:sensor histidine kinase [Palleronia sp. LCG004]|uniref:sensor histidine kinase n=1 Tax=Palleronia sp. LCG004 TaxID=3079304 RepID=UPI002943A374|nr:histidine kinase dimerization/phospho-acceptor domain-containing protein [Palleronia sp. LCG004]WOI55712.1 histidine kinase dimerization/phospho-acceptor domain-containing protein [Palleronia sp. LCG004]
MSAHWTLTGRLVRRILTIVILGWSLAMALGLWSLAHEIDESLDRGLEIRARYALDLLEAGVPAEEIPIGEGDVLSIDGDAAPWPKGDGASRSTVSWHVFRAERSGRAVEIGQSSAFRREEFWESAGAFIVVMVPLVIVVALTVVLTVRAALGPARRLAATIAGRDAADFTPLSAKGLPGELRPMALSVNDHLERIDRLLTAERSFAANAAHELRTPLATARAETAALAAGHGSIERVDRGLERLTRIVDRLLQLARAEAGDAARAQPVDLVSLARHVLAEFPAGVVLDDGDASRMMVRTDADLVAIVLRNLVANALEHGLGSVRVRIGPDMLAVENRAAPGAVLHAARFDKGRTSQGTGLGLTIVETIAQQLDLTLDRCVTDDRVRVALHFPIDEVS